MRMVDTEVDLLILGLGNVLCGDDGLGVMTVREIEARYDVPGGVRVVDGGTMGLSLLPLLQEAQQVLMIDAIRDDCAPGSLVAYAGADVAPAARERLSPHDVGVADLLDGADLLGCAPEKVALLGLVPQCMELGIGLSPAVVAGIPALVERIVAEAAACGKTFRLKSHVGVHEPARVWA